ncbi:ABC transporter permease [Desulfosporosinus nitroreducens]|uniref:ABC transporter permease n=1 Tax=Desulfosporosinus nitroreducens TaxID=2018668 RepID=A0ABT8QKW3_9FIRM|nr:ABC transporter permease [Desulfosporosinus nitroreducens]MDO0821249.1 ABC transporter permease [Desulfosporosinus nitroreducens]
MSVKFRNIRIPALIQTVLLIMALFLIWELAARAGKVDTFFFSSPNLIGSDIVKMWTSGDISQHVGVTFKEAFYGLIYGGVLGTVCAFIFGMNKKLHNILFPIIVGMNGLPKLALGPLLIFWFGIGIESKIVMSAVMVFFIFLFNIYAGYCNVDVTLINAVRMMGGNQWQIMRKVIWPSCIPWFLVSLRTGLGMSIMGAIVGEYIGANKGLGWMIQNAGGTYNITRVISCIFLLIILMASLDYFVKFLEKKILRWRPTVE